MQLIDQFIKVKTDHYGHIYSEGFYVSSKNEKLILSGIVGVTQCRRNCHVDPHKTETCFRAFSKFKLTNAPHLYLTQILSATWH